MNKKDKTNVMRFLEQQKVDYQALKQPLNVNEYPVYKTLVTIGASKQHYVFLVPIKRHLDLKKAAKAVEEKSVEMIKEKDLLPLTGYVHGGCSPLGMKKRFKTVIDQQVHEHPDIVFSAGKVGWSVLIKTSDMFDIIDCHIAAIAS